MGTKCTQYSNSKTSYWSIIQEVKRT